MKIGDIIEVDGKKVLITAVNGTNYSYADVPEKAVEKKVETEAKDTTPEEETSKRRPRKK